MTFPISFTAYVRTPTHSVEQLCFDCVLMQAHIGIRSKTVVNIKGLTT